MPSRCNLAALLSALSLVTACAPSAPCRDPVSEAIPVKQITPSMKPATAMPAAVTAPRGYLLTVLRHAEDDNGQPRQAIFLNGHRGSMPYYVMRKVAELARTFPRRDIPTEQRAPYDEWAQRALENGGAFFRAELTLSDDRLSAKFVALRGGQLEKVAPPEDTLIHVALLYDVPIYVEIAYLKEIGRLLSPP